MKIGDRTFVWPWLFSFSRTSWSISSTDHFLVLQVGSYEIRIHWPMRMGGTMRTTSFVIQFFRKVYSKEVWHQFSYAFQWEFRFCWRPDVTHYYFIRNPRYKREKLKAGGLK